MYRVMSESSGNIIGIQVCDKLTQDDYKSLVPLLEQAIDEYGKIRLLWHMENFEGWNLDALWKDLKFDTEHNDDVERLALVGDKQWEKWVSKPTKLFYGNAKYFDRAQLQDAWAWVRE